MGIANIYTVAASYAIIRIDNGSVATATVVHHLQYISPASLYTMPASATLVCKDL